jgi:small GTP-binding protein
MAIAAVAHPFKVVVAGATCVGKSSVIKRLIQGSFSDTEASTTGADFFTYMCPVENETIHLQIWDTAGQERFRSISKAYFRNAVAGILVYDITSLSSFDELMDWLAELRGLALPNAYILIVGNKADLASRREVAPGVVKEFAATHGLESIEASARNGQNVTEAFTRLAFEIHARSKAARRPVNAITAQRLSPAPASETCC